MDPFNMPRSPRARRPPSKPRQTAKHQPKVQNAGDLGKCIYNQGLTGAKVG